MSCSGRAAISREAFPREVREPCSVWCWSRPGLYQFTRQKRACLSHCRSPLGFVMQNWREGRLGALRMGLHHGLYCLGCCWVLFAAPVAAGIMSLAWMLLLTLVLFAEKVLPQGQRIAKAIGLLFVLAGLLVAFEASWA
jgi:predicted metal-binding membrane protein